jgi:hypothetical protein
MSLFRKQPTVVPTTSEDREAAPPVPPAAPPLQAQATLFSGANVDIAAVYRSARLSAEELDRVSRAEELLHLLPSTAANTREVVDATFRAFSVDRTKIIEAASKQLGALESFIRLSHEETQRAHDTGQQKIAELEREIERCRQILAQASSEGEQRAQVVNDILLKVQRVLDFFGDNPHLSDEELEADTALVKPDDDAKPAKVSSAKAAQRPASP